MAKRIYLSAPCTGYDDAEIDEYFGKWQRYFESFGYTVFNPRKNGLPKSCSWIEHMRKDISELCKCDVLVCLTKERSKGVLLEIDTAQRLGLLVVTYDQVMRCKHKAKDLDFLLS